MGQTTIYPNCICCGGDTGTGTTLTGLCSACSVAPTQWDITFNGAPTSGGAFCLCDGNIGGTYTLTHTGTTGCVWSTTIPDYCGGASTVLLRLFYNSFSGIWVFAISDVASPGSPYVTWTLLLASFLCLGSNVMSGGGSDGRASCVFPATVTVAPT